MMNLKRDLKEIENIMLTNEEQERLIRKLQIQNDNLSFQIAEYRQIVEELSKKLKNLL